LSVLSDWSQDDLTKAIPPGSAAAQDISKQGNAPTSPSTQDRPTATLPTRADEPAPASLLADRARGYSAASTSTQGITMPPDRPAATPMVVWPLASISQRVDSRRSNTMSGGAAARAPRANPPEPDSSRNAPAPQGAGYRPIDETGNNRANPNWGSAGTDLLRVSPVGYADGISAPSLPQDPSARAISNILNNQAGPNDPSQDMNT